MSPQVINNSLLFPFVKYCPYCGGKLQVKGRQSHKYRFFCSSEECEAIEIKTKRIKGLGIVFYATKTTLQPIKEAER